MPPADTNGHESDISNSEPSDTTPAPAPKYMTAEEFNKAHTARERAFEKALEKKFQAMLSESLGSVTSEVDKLLTEKFGNASAAPAAKAKSTVEDDPMVRGLKKQLDELKAKAELAEQRANAEQTKQRNASLRQKAAEELAKHGVDSARTRPALALLIDAEQRIRWGEDGESIVFRDSDGQDVDFGTGLKDWAKTDEAKIFMPPRGTVGSGERPGPAKKPAPVTTREQLGEALFDRYVKGGL